MIILEYQLKALLFSFFFGMFFSLALNINYNIIYKGKMRYRIITNIMFVFNMVLIYFLVMKKICNAIIHPYFVLMVIIGFMIFNNNFKLYFQKIKNKVSKKIKNKLSRKIKITK